MYIFFSWLKKTNTKSGQGFSGFKVNIKPVGQVKGMITHPKICENTLDFSHSKNFPLKQNVAPSSYKSGKFLNQIIFQSPFPSIPTKNKKLGRPRPK